MLRLPLLVRVVLLLLPLAACSGFEPDRAPPTSDVFETAQVTAVPRARLWGDFSSPQQRSLARSNYIKATRAKWLAAGRPAEGVEINLLALSGGGPDGAFAAGLLIGWTEAGGRPDFDLVSGISVGALIAPFAFIGADGDAALRTIFTEFGIDHVAEFNPVAAVFGALGVADTAPLKRTIAQLVTEDFLKRVAEEDQRGRSLFIGTTNIDAARPVIWDMGQIAIAGELQLFRDVMLASASIPGVFPPVPITVEAGGREFIEYHVDGGVTRSVIVWPHGFEAAAVTRDLPFPLRQTIYVIQNNTLSPSYTPIRGYLPAIAGRAVSTLIRSQTEGDLVRIYLGARATESEFRLIYVPGDFVMPGGDDLDQAYMRALFDRAYRDALDGIDWADRPPGLIVPAEIRAAQPLPASGPGGAGPAPLPLALGRGNG